MRVRSFPFVFEHPDFHFSFGSPALSETGFYTLAIRYISLKKAQVPYNTDISFPFHGFGILLKTGPVKPSICFPASANLFFS